MNKKEELRPVQWPYGHSFFQNEDVSIAAARQPLSRRMVDGYFHLWQKLVAENGDETVRALVETLQGDILYIAADDLTFTDRK